MKQRITFFLAFLVMSATYGQKIDTSAFLPETTIQANRIQEQALESAKGIFILDSEDLRALPARTTQEALQYVAGVHINTRSFAHVQADVSIRGGSFDQVLLLVDGVKLNDSQTGHHNMNIPVPLNMIERIEVVKGPGARIYGPNAFAGVINIITKSNMKDQVGLQYYRGGFDSEGGAISAAASTGGIQHQASVRVDQSEGFRENTDYNVKQIYYKASGAWGKHRLTFQTAYNERKFGANGFYADTSFNDQYEEIQTSYAALQHQYNGKSLVLRSNLYWRRNQDIYLFLRSDPDFYRNFHLGNNLGAESNLQWMNALGQSGFGVDLRREILRSNLLGNRERDVAAVSAEHQFQWWDDQLLVTPGVVYNYYSDHGSTFLPGIEMAYRMADQWTLTASTGRTFRVPTYTDLYYESPAELGNPNLVAETAWSSEIGIRHLSRQWDAQYVFFQRRVSDLIDWQRDEGLWVVNNLDQPLRIYGQEMALRWRPTSHGFDLLKIEQLSTQLTLLHPVQELDENSRYTFDMLNVQWVSGASIRIFDRLHLRPSYRLNQPNPEARIPARKVNYHLLDLNLTYSWGDNSIFVEAVNLLDTEHYGPGGVLLPGRWLRTGATLKFMGQ